MYQGYRCNQPQDVSTYVCRYVDVAGLISLLSSKKLHFTRIGSLPDKFEGMPPKNHRQMWIDGMRRSIAAEQENGISTSGMDAVEIADRMISMVQAMRAHVYASCWAFGAEESEALWRIYCPSGLGVAMQLPYEALRNSLPQGFRCGLVEYIDHATVTFDINTASLDFAMCKRIPFSHEREVRCLQFNICGQDKIFLDWDPEKLLSRVLISPYADPWHENVIRQCVEKFAPGLADKVQRSAMAEPPDF